MKFSTLVGSLVLFSSFSASAAPSKTFMKWFSNQLNGKSLVCTPEGKRGTTSTESDRGDYGYFTLSAETVKRKKQIVISDSGDSGYGFSNGNINGAVHLSHVLFLEVGDDGSQTLRFDFSSIGADSEYPKNCAVGILISESEVNILESDNVECCLK